MKLTDAQLRELVFVIHRLKAAPEGLVTPELELMAEYECSLRGYEIADYFMLLLQTERQLLL